MQHENEFTLIRRGRATWIQLADGRLLPIPAGGSGDDDGADDQDDSTDTGDDDQDDDADDKPLGPKGEKALKAEKDKRRRAQAQLREFKDLGMTAAELKALAESRNGNGDSDDGPDAEQIRRDAERAADARANQKIVRAEVKAAAVGKLADPADALAFLDLTKFEVDDDGEVDEDEITEAIGDLLKRKPHLAGKAARFEGEADNGVREPTEADVKPGLPRLRNAYEKRAAKSGAKS